MSLNRLLIFVVGLDVVLSTISTGIEYTGLNSATVVAADQTPLLVLPEFALNCLMTLFLICLVIGWIGILRFWNPGRFFYLAAWFLSILGACSQAFFVQSTFSYLMSVAVSFSGGFLVCLIFASELRTKYGHKAELRS